MQDPAMRVTLSCKEDQWGVVQLGEIGKSGQCMDVVEPSGGRDGSANTCNGDDALHPLGRWGLPYQGRCCRTQEGAEVFGCRKDGERAPVMEEGSQPVADDLHNVRCEATQGNQSTLGKLDSEASSQ